MKEVEKQFPENCIWFNFFLPSLRVSMAFFQFLADPPYLHWVEEEGKKWLVNEKVKCKRKKGKSAIQGPMAPQFKLKFLRIQLVTILTGDTSFPLGNPCAYG